MIKILKGKDDMKKKMMIMALCAFMFTLGGCGSSSKASDTTKKEDTTSKKESDSGIKGFDLSTSYIEADGKKLELPCTLDELLAFGFTIEAISSSEITGVDMMIKDYLGEPEVDLVFSDGSKYHALLSSPDFREETRFGDFIVSEFSDPSTSDQSMGMEPENTLGETTLLINGVARTDEYKESLKPFEGNGYEKGQYQDSTVENYEMDGKDGEKIEMNGYEVSYITMYIDGFEVDGASRLYRSVSFWSPKTIDEE